MSLLFELKLKGKSCIVCIIFCDLDLDDLHPTLMKSNLSRFGQQPLGSYKKINPLLM